MEILITNAGEDPIEIEADTWDLTRYKDAHRASDFRISCSRRVPVQKYAHVIAKDGSKTLFRGYVKSPKLKNINTRELNCKGEEDLLLRRCSGRYSYVPSARTIGHAFQSDVPSQAADTYGVTGNLGALFIANSLIPFHGMVLTAGDPYQDWYSYGSGKIYKLAGLGTDSRIGSAAIYSEGLLLPRVDTFAELQATPISCWSDTEDLWVRCDDTAYHGWGPRKALFAANAYDTGVVAGNIAKTATYLTGQLTLDFDRILDLLIDLAEFNLTVPVFRYGADHTYLDTLVSYPEDEFYLPEDSLQDIQESVSSDQRVHALVGRGAGSRDVQQLYSMADHTWKGVWYAGTFDVDDGCLDSGGVLKSTVESEYNRLLDDQIFTVRPKAVWSARPDPGSMVRLALDGDKERLLQVASAKTNSAGQFEMELGTRSKDIIDAFNAKSSLSKVYTQEYLVQSYAPITGSGTLITGDTTHGWCGGFSGSFTVPSGVHRDDESQRIFIDISINANVNPEPMLVNITINGLQNQYCQPIHYLIGDSITKLDITRLVTYGAVSTINVYVQRKSNWPNHLSCADHPVANVSYTVTCYNSAANAELEAPPSGEGQYVLRPTDDGYIGIYYPHNISHYDKVDDTSPDYGTTQISTPNGGGYQYDLYTLTAMTHENEIGAVKSVTVYFLCKRTANECRGYGSPVLSIGGTFVRGVDKTVSTSWNTYSQSWNQSPITKKPWTWAEIRAMQAGVGLTNYLGTGFAYTYCTQVYVVVNYA